MLDLNLAERKGFEPPIRLPVYRISSPAHSTTLPPLRVGLMDGIIAGFEDARWAFLAGLPAWHIIMALIWILKGW